MDYFLARINDIDCEICFFQDVLVNIPSSYPDTDQQELVNNMTLDTRSTINELLRERSRNQNMIEFIKSNSNCAVHDIIKKMLE